MDEIAYKVLRIKFEYDVANLMDKLRGYRVGELIKLEYALNKVMKEKGI